MNARHQMPIFIYLFIWALFSLIQHCSASVDGLYCGLENCYDVLGVQQSDSRADITRAYRRLAKEWHPDTKKADEKEAATEMFRKIANAYEILKDEQSREDYDYMLDHPDEMYYNYYRYYRRQVAPQVDVRIVIVAFISVASVVHYYCQWSNYHTAVNYLLTVPKYRMRAVEIARSDGLLKDDADKKRKSRGKTKEELRDEEEAILKKVLVEKMDIRGGYSKPTWIDFLWIQLLLAPFRFIKWIYWHLRWWYSFTILRRPYGDEEKRYLIQCNMKLSRGQFESLPDEQIDEYLELELWKKANFKEWQEEQEDKMRQKMAENSRYKAYRRYMRRGGPGQLSMADDD